MSVTTSMNKARLCFEARGRFRPDPRGYPWAWAVREQRCFRRRDKVPTATRVAKPSAAKGTALPGAAIDAHGVGISLRGMGVATHMTQVRHQRALP